jgi:hypothetical protein
VAWTTTAAVGEAGTSAHNRILAARRPSADDPFTGAEPVAAGVLRAPVVAAGAGGSVIGWSAEDTPEAA